MSSNGRAEAIDFIQSCGYLRGRTAPYYPRFFQHWNVARWKNARIARKFHVCFSIKKYKGKFSFNGRNSVLCTTNTMFTKVAICNSLRLNKYSSQMYLLKWLVYSIRGHFIPPARSPLT